MKQENIQKIMYVNGKAKDTFFKKVYETEERKRKLAAYLLGIEGRKISTANVRPVLFGNKENDLAFLCNDVFYVMMEEQSSISPNIPYRLLEYITAGLRSTVDSEQLLYGKKRVYFPIPKLYVLQVGVVQCEKGLPEHIQYDIHLSESYISADRKYKENVSRSDLEVVVHVYDFSMTQNEILKYIEQDILPDRFLMYNNDMRDYALVANGITYIQKAERNAKYIMPVNISTVAEYLELMLGREIFVDLLSDKEVCDMTMAQFSRDDILIYQGREEGREEGIQAFILDKMEDGVEKSIVIDKLQRRFGLDEESARQYYKTYAK